MEILHRMMDWIYAEEYRFSQVLSAKVIYLISLFLIVIIEQIYSLITDEKITTAQF